MTDRSAPHQHRDLRRRESRERPEVVQRFESHLDLADRLARRYERPGTADDVRQVARLGLLLAARRFDPAAGVFVRYATVTIVGELKKHLRQTDWALRVPRSLQEDSLAVSAIVDALAPRLGRTPTPADVAADLGWMTERVVEALRVRTARRSSPYPEVDVHAHVDDADRALLVADALDALDADQRDLIQLRFVDGLTQREIGERIGTSQPQVHRRLSGALVAMRERLERK